MCAVGDAGARYRLGIDIGGTFTDFSLFDERTGELIGLKSPTVPGDPGRGVPTASSASPASTARPGEIDYLVHGTTIAVNTLIQRTGAAAGPPRHRAASATCSRSSACGCRTR